MWNQNVYHPELMTPWPQEANAPSASPEQFQTDLLNQLLQEAHAQQAAQVVQAEQATRLMMAWSQEWAQPAYAASFGDLAPPPGLSQEGDGLHPPAGHDDAELAKCYEEAVNAFLVDENYDEESAEQEDGTAGTALHHQVADAPVVAAPVIDAPVIVDTAADSVLSQEQPFSEPSLERPTRSRRGPGSRYWCTFHLDEAYLQFKVCSAIIGRHVEHTRDIFDKTGAKIRVRGRGSGHLESGTGTEAPTNLMVTVSAPQDSQVNFTNAVKLTGELLVRTEQKIMRDQVGFPAQLRLCWQVSMYDGQNYHLASDGSLESEDDTALKAAEAPDSMPLTGHKVKGKASGKGIVFARQRRKGNPAPKMEGPIGTRRPDPPLQS